MKPETAQPASRSPSGSAERCRERPDWREAIGSEHEARLEAAFERFDSLPILHGTYQRVLSLAEDPESSTAELVATLERDEAFAANLLRFANSAHYSRRIPARTIRQAVMLVGRRAIRDLCLEAATYRFLELAPGNGRASRGQMHVHAVAVGTCAQAAAREAGIPSEEAHLAGLLHDFGKLFLPLAYGERELDAIVLHTPAGRARASAERERLGIDHAYAGALFASRSGLPAQVSAAIAQHHGVRRPDEQVSPIAACVQLANAIVGLLAGQEIDQALIDATLERLSLGSEVLDAIAERLVPEGERVQLGDVAQRVAELERLSQIDDLTELASRRHWLSTVRDLLDNAASGSLLLIDVDEFKSINDKWGHRAGDLVLTEVANVLQGHGFAGRLGGDELVLWLDLPLAAAQAVAQQIVAEVAQEFDRGDEPGPRVGVSIGIAGTPAQASELGQLIELADAALYRAKAQGGGRALVADLPRPVGEAAAVADVGELGHRRYR